MIILLLKNFIKTIFALHAPPFKESSDKYKQFIMIKSHHIHMSMHMHISRYENYSVIYLL